MVSSTEFVERKAVRKVKDMKGDLGEERTGRGGEQKGKNK